MNDAYQQDRRTLLRFATFAVVMSPLLQACDGPGHTCADPDSLSTSDQHLRETLEYVEIAASGDQLCSTCQFYSGEGNCGECEILSGSVSRQGWCSSWAASG